MSQRSNPIFIGDTVQQQSERDVRGEFADLLGEKFYKIESYDRLAPFFMSIVSSSNHWLFISSTGGLSAGRVSAEQSLFPYYTDDKLTENNGNTGHKSILLVKRGERVETTFSFNCWLAPDLYSVSIAVHSPNSVSFDWMDGALFFRVFSDVAIEGVANLNAHATTRSLAAEARVTATL